MEVPEKLFVAIIHPLSNGHTEMIALEHGDGVEYIRKDAFIEKACEWIKYNTQNGGCLFDGWEEDFKKYILIN